MKVSPNQDGILPVWNIIMTKLLKEAFDKASELPEEAQDQFARWVIEELASEKEWTKLLKSSPQAVSTLAKEAIAEHRDGRTEPLDPDNL